ncbi:MAG: ABC transporter substrate-binding protein [Acidimicrobiales bacterium]|jgi:iron complex transport system substrate-binding protein|nr:ABC transporter substrate-binding protein [Acidimicrobiales bacterium]HJM27757.1 ABC transporter substrate-binding protein [Acidimicrobiales bacterium]
MKKTGKLIPLLGILVLSCSAIGCSRALSEVKASDERANTETSEQAFSGTEGNFPLTLEIGENEIIVEAKPTRILSLSPSATEILFAIGAGDQVAAVDEQSNYPPEAPMSGISGYTPNLESIIALEPDLVVHSYLPEDIEKGLANVGIPSLPQLAPLTLEDTYQQISQLGLVTGNTESAQSIIQIMQERVDQLIVRASSHGSLSFYHELDQSYFSVTSMTFIGQIYATLGLENIADAADSAGSGYPQLSEEYILSQNPDLIFLADTKCCAQSLETVKQRNGWRALSAVENQKVIELDDDIASRWGPRIIQFFEEIVDAMEQID